jgi:Carbamoyltransferase C-terminus/ABC-2 type transporter
VRGSDPNTRERVLVLEPGRAERHYWRDLWHYRELFAILAWRDVAVRYKQTVIGVAWAVVRPLLTMLVFTIVFGKLAGLPSDGAVPYPVLVFAGMLPWFLFASVLSEASNSLIGNANLIGKVYFFREEKRRLIPAVIHVDGSGRLQTVYRQTSPRYWHLIDSFHHISGVPMVLNTSFNENEPVVCRPVEALDCFLRTSMDVLVLGDWFIHRKRLC